MLDFCRLLCLTVACAAILQAADPHMTAEERSKVVALLKQSQEELLAAVEGLTDQQWNYKPGPDRWSIGETAEHILLAEGMLFGSVKKALDSSPNPDWEAKTARKAAFIERVMTDRSRKAQAPEAIKPTGMSRAQILERYKAVRAQTLKFAESTDLPIKEHTSEHPFPVFNTLNAYDWLLYIPLHNLRHNMQIAEVKASPGYPK
jgi:uncharacterized damage-inducible protein DinB